MSAGLQRYTFEVFGKVWTALHVRCSAMSLTLANMLGERQVQGVFFRKYTKQRADELGLVGFVQNTTKRERTVVGEIQGAPEACEQMIDWLQTTGSPKSRIDRCAVRGPKAIAAATYSSFDIAGTE